MLNVEGKLIKNPQILADTFNSYFSKTVEESVNNVIKQDLKQTNKITCLEYLVRQFSQPFLPINPKPVTEKEIFEINKSLKWKNSCGYDQIPNRIVKVSMPFISSPLSYICNKMLTTGTFLARLKYAQVVPVFKKGSKVEITAYRPISLLTSFTKIFEKVIFNRLLQHTKINNIIVSEQYGFRGNSSTELAIFNLTNQILAEVNKKSSVCGIFCDLTKAFDTVNHNILINKLEYYGIVGRFGELIKSYLSNRYQRVITKSLQMTNYVSAWELIKYGVPQGSVLGPLLFLFYINDLPQSVKGLAKSTLFADDTSFIIANFEPQKLDQDVKVVLENVQNWFKSNRMLLNYKKTNFMRFFPNTNKMTVDTIDINTYKIDSVNSTKFLGIIIESTLAWKEHIDHINSKLNSLGYMIRSLRPVLGLRILKQIYYSYVHSVLNYGIMFWGNSTHSRTIFITQKRILRSIVRAKPNDPCREIFRKLGILTLYSQYIFSTLIFVVKYKDMFITNTEVHEMNTRHKLNLHVPSVRLTRVQKGLYYSGISLYNSLPLNIKKVAYDFCQFRHKLKDFLIENSFYSIEEFLNMNERLNVGVLKYENL